MKYKEWLNIWLENYVNSTTKKRTRERYSQIVKHHIIERLGDYELNNISLFELQKFVTELIALTWENVDLLKGTLTIKRTCYDGKDEQGKLCRVEDEPKTASSKRTIPLPKQILKLLKEHKKKNKSEYVISDYGKPLFVRSYQRSFDLLLKKLKIQHKGFHALRHTFATRALECGMDVKMLSEILGHKNPTITLCRYAHSMIEYKKEMMNKLGKILE